MEPWPPIFQHSSAQCVGGGGGRREDMNRIKYQLHFIPSSQKKIIIIIVDKKI